MSSAAARRRAACCCGAASRRTSAWCRREPRRGAAVLHRLEGAQHRAARPRHRARLEAERVRAVRQRRRTAGGRRDRGRHLRGARPGLRPAGASRESRRDRGCRAARRCPALDRAADIRGDLHCHTDATDGRDDIEAMAQAAQAAGSPTSPSPTTARRWRWPDGLDEAARRSARGARPRARRAGSTASALLAGIECDIRPDGTLDLADDCLAQLDVVVASVHSRVQPGRGADDRPAASAPSSRRASTSSGTRPAACCCGAMPTRSTWSGSLTRRPRTAWRLEINCQVDRLDLNDTHARLARDNGGVKLVIDTDSHSAGRLRDRCAGA